MIITLLIAITLGVALLPHIAYIIAKVLALFFHFHVAYRPFGFTALGLAGLWLCLFAYGNLFGRYFHETKKVEIPCKGLPESFKGYRIVHISDLHLDGYAGKEDVLLSIVNDINALKPDLICFTGDLISIDESELPPCIPQLKQLKAKDGVVSIFGNHDYMPYKRMTSKREWTDRVNRLARMEHDELGWELLLNNNLFIHRGNDSIAIVGCENQSMGISIALSAGVISPKLWKEPTSPSALSSPMTLLIGVARYSERRVPRMTAR